MFVGRKLQVELLEARQMLTAYFPTYVNGEFTLSGESPDESLYGYDNTFQLSTNPSATKTIYLDFNGHHSVDNSWGHDIVFPPYNTSGGSGTFSNSELREIQRIFQNVAEDFAPFEVNLTTVDPGVEGLTRTRTSDSTYGVRSLMTQATSGFGNGIGGVAYVNSFDDGTDNPVFVFNKGVNNGSMTASHEVGHALGLSHDGLNSQEYHPGSGGGDTGWGPIMGAPFGRNVTQWSNGDYAGSTAVQDDLTIITKPINGFGFRPDDHGNDSSTATAVANDDNVFDWGIITNRDDVDVFEFAVSDGTFDVQIRAFDDRPNLDIEATLTDAQGNVLLTDNPLDGTDASITTSLTAGTYYLSIDGVGRDGRYSDYGSLGFYSVEGLINSTIGGDFNADGALDVVDLDMLMHDVFLTLSDQGNPDVFDLNGDNTVDLNDRDAWLAAAGAANLQSGLSYLVGDANLDGLTNIMDYQIWTANKFSSSTKWSDGNFNGDGVIDGIDLLAWNANKFMDVTGGPALVAGRSAEVAADAFSDTAGDDIDYEAGPVWPLSHDAHMDDAISRRLDFGGCSCPACCADWLLSEHAGQLRQLDTPSFELEPGSTNMHTTSNMAQVQLKRLSRSLDHPTESNEPGEDDQPQSFDEFWIQQLAAR